MEFSEAKRLLLRRGFDFRARSLHPSTRKDAGTSGTKAARTPQSMLSVAKREPDWQDLIVMRS